MCEEEERHMVKEMEQCFLEHVSQLSNIQKKHLERREQEWERTMNRLKKYHSLKVEETSSEDMFKSLTLDDPLSSPEDQYEELLKQMLSVMSSLVDKNEKIFQTKRREMLEKYREAINKEQDQMETAKDKLDMVTSEHQRLTERLERVAKELQNDKKKKNVLQSKRLSQETELAKVKEQQVQIESQKQKLRSRVDCGRKSARERLIQLSMQSNRAATSLSHAISQGERVLRMAALCKKMEDKLQLTEELQKVVEENQQTEDGAQEVKPPYPGLLTYDKCELPELRLLELQSAVVREKCSVLQKQRDALRRQNQQLQSQITDKLSARRHLEVRRGSDSGPPHKL
ncbi:dynein regulatory complex subunit 2-like [Boleophthalmus pectinirostris]|uniref:dynein regulatory complex subunit 2-like n=1 Tax=Boleophthalmus pectinirostris TaxID=150288 RepID=UPI0024327A36|nr:dynein regulatory complex subunit 2-like [Boleophthalmus pectinirostris]